MFFFHLSVLPHLVKSSDMCSAAVGPSTGAAILFWAAVDTVNIACTAAVGAAFGAPASFCLVRLLVPLLGLILL